MSATAEEFYSKWAKAWRQITGSPAYKDAIDTIHQTSECLHILDYTPPEVKGIGDILLAKQQGALETLNALTKLADVPPEMGSDEPPESQLYPDPLDELAEEMLTTKPRRRK